MVALKIVEQYRKQFDYLDVKPVDDMLNAEELGVGFRDFGNIYLIQIGPKLIHLYLIQQSTQRF